MLTDGFKALAETLQEAAQMSHSDLRTQLHAAVKAKHPNDYPHILDVFGDHTAGDVVYAMGDSYHQAPYTVTKSGNQNGSTSTTKIGDHHQVTPRTTYQKVRPANEALKEIEIADEFVSLREGAVAQDGQTLLKLIAPGWGSSGHYSEAVLKRDGPKVFRAGTKNFWNHQTAAEESARPEGNLDDLASVLTEDAKYQDGPKGPGLYAKAKVYEHYRKPIDEMSKDIGVSIRAQGRAREGTAPDGKKGLLIEELTKAISADYVTTPGAGGKVVSLFESARARQIEDRKENEMDQSEVTKIAEAAVTKAIEPLKAENLTMRGENKKLRERLAVSEAAGEADTILATLSLHEGVRARVKGRVLSGVIPLTEGGDLDTAKLKTMLEAEAKDEAAYVAKLSETGVVKGMGKATEQLAELSEADYEKQAVESFMASGLTEAQAKIAAKGRAN